MGAVAGIKKRSLVRGSGAGRGTSWERESGTPDRSRTYDTQLRKLVLYPLSYGRIQGHYSVKVGKCKGSATLGEGLLILERLFARIKVLKSCTAQCVPTAGLLFFCDSFATSRGGRGLVACGRGGEDCIIGVCVREI